MNKKSIKPVKFWTPDGNKSADTLMLYNFHGYNFDGSDSVVSYKLGFIEAEDRWVSLSEGSVQIPDAVVQSWASDDDPIFDYVLTQLKLTEV